MKTSPLITSKNSFTGRQKILVGEVSHDELSLDSLRIISVDKIKSYSSIPGDSQNVQYKKAPSSTLSSIVMASNKGGVKRKLNFDADYSSDEDSSIRRENGKRMCLRDFRSINSSLIDTDSNTFSPSKNRHPSVASYSRSSVGSSCRRRLLFPSNKSKTDASNLESPISRPNGDSKQEIRLSLKKKFPGVPNSDNARSGLLLNLAFSKYNLPNAVNSDKKNNVSYDFVDRASVSRTTKKEFIHYRSIEKDDSSLCRSPVFMAIKKVKRRLNLEEQESCASVKGSNHSLHSKERTPSKNSDAISGSKTSADVSTKNQPSYVAFSRRSDCDRQLRADLTNENENSPRLSSNALTSAAAKRQPSTGDLFKNSRLRSTLRNKIFDLSTFSADAANFSATETNENAGRETLDISSNERDFSAKTSRDLRRKLEYDRIVMRQDLADRTKKDAERLKRLSMISSGSLNVRRVSRRASTSRSVRTHQKNDTFKLKCSSSFIDGHLKRFLNDCSDMAKLKLPNDENESQLSANGDRHDIQCSASFRESNQSEQTCGYEENNSMRELPYIDSAPVSSSKLIEESDSDDNSVHDNQVDEGNLCVSHHIIEDVNSQVVQPPSAEPRFSIENVFSQERPSEYKNISISDISMDDNDLKECVQRERISVSSNSEMEDTAELPHHKIEEVATPKSEFSDVRVYSCQSRNRSPVVQDTEDILNSQQKKRSRKKHGPDTLCGRLQRLVKRDASEARMWEYEISKGGPTFADNVSNGKLNCPVVFCVGKMWKEFSRLIILCSRMDSDVPDEQFSRSDLKDCGINVSNSVIIITDCELFPKSITCSTTFRVHPPWRILYSSALNLQIIFRPAKVEVVSTNGKPLLYKDSTLPVHPRVVERKQFCFCADNLCNCVLPEQYLTVMPCLLSVFSDYKAPPDCRLRSYGVECVRSVRTFDDLILMYRLVFAEMYSDFEIFHTKWDFDEKLFWHICNSEQDEICCVVMNGDIKSFSAITTHRKFRFTGLIPWKVVPSRLVPTFVKYLNITEKELISKFETNGIYVFMLSREYGNVCPVLA